MTQKPAGSMAMDEGAASAASFEHQYGELRTSLTRTAFLLCGSATIAEELTQDVFEAAYRHWDEIDDAPAYLRRALLNRTKNVFRSQDRHRLYAPPPPDVVSIEIVELRDSLMRLPYRQRAVIALRYYVGLSDLEIADALHCTRSTVRSSARRALNFLRKELTP